jgi:hypothetical protein
VWSSTVLQIAVTYSNDAAKAGFTARLLRPLCVTLRLNQLVPGARFGSEQCEQFTEYTKLKSLP